MSTSSISALTHRLTSGSPQTLQRWQELAAQLTTICITAPESAELAHALFNYAWRDDDIANFTLAMAESGPQLNWRDIDKPVVDKHSTGGVGDKVTLIAVPIVVACGAAFPKLSGGGLAHTGGTLDKLRAIPHYQPLRDNDFLKSVLKAVGGFMAGATHDLAPADKKLYQLRHLTHTVSSIPLIAASIMSKKLATGAQHIVLDMKMGQGALLPPDQMPQLATTMTMIGQHAGRNVRCVMTDMNQVLGHSAGHAVEVMEAIDYLMHAAPPHPLLQKTVEAVCAELLLASRLAATPDEATAMIHRTISSGAAAEKLSAIIHKMGGMHDLMRVQRQLLADRQAYTQIDVPVMQSGVVKSIDVRALGELLIDMGGGVKKSGDEIDLNVGLINACSLGDTVNQHDTLVTLIVRKHADATTFMQKAQQAFGVA